MRSMELEKRPSAYGRGEERLTAFLLSFGYTDREQRGRLVRHFESQAAAIGTSPLELAEERAASLAERAFALPVSTEAARLAFLRTTGAERWPNALLGELPEDACRALAAALPQPRPPEAAGEMPPQNLDPVWRAFSRRGSRGGRLRVAPVE